MENRRREGRIENLKRGFLYDAHTIIGEFHRVVEQMKMLLQTSGLKWYMPRKRKSIYPNVRKQPTPIELNK